MLKLAAISGSDPYSEDLTPFDIYWMAQGVMEEKWDHTASLMMLQYNCNAKKPKKMVDFHPFRSKQVEHTGKKGQITGTPLEAFRRICKNTEGREEIPPSAGVVVKTAPKQGSKLAGTPLDAFKNACKKGNR